MARRRRRTVAVEGAHPVDVYVGKRIRLRRSLTDMNQSALGEALGLTFQQVQKYEKGANRVSASKLYEIARLFDVPIGWFFDGFDPHAPGDGFDERMEDSVITDLIRYVGSIADETVRKCFVELLRAVSELRAAAD